MIKNEEDMPAAGFDKIKLIEKLKKTHTHTHEQTNKQ